MYPNRTLRIVLIFLAAAAFLPPTAFSQTFKSPEAAAPVNLPPEF